MWADRDVTRVVLARFISRTGGEAAFFVDDQLQSVQPVRGVEGQSIEAGINVVHINTELRIAWRRGLEEGLAKEKSEVVPYKILPVAVAAVQAVVRSRLRLFNRMS